nr:hypothetical protein [uncultured Oscillibacter sp.]
MNRGRKILRNLLLSVLLALLVYALLDFPPYTVQGMLDRMEREYLLSDLEPVVVRGKSYKFGNETFANHTTFLLARTGDSYVTGVFDRSALEVYHGVNRDPGIMKGTLCAAFNGTIYVAGDFADVGSASVEVTAQRTTRLYERDSEESELTYGERKTFSYPGVKLSDAVLAFSYQEEGISPGAWGPNTGLEGAAFNWYSSLTKGEGGRGILHADLPVTVTLYGRDGEVSGALELSIDNYELYAWW